MAKLTNRKKNISATREKNLRDIEAFNIFGDNQIISESIDQNYVFYKNLQEYRPSFYKKVQNELSRASQALKDTKPNASVLRTMALNEARAEVRAINMSTKILNIDENQYIKDLQRNPIQTFTWILETLNTLMNSKQVFERSVRRILADNKKDGKARTDIGTVLFSYIERSMYIQSSINGLENAYKNACEASNSNLETIDKTITRYIEEVMVPNAVRRGINQALASKTFRGADDTDRPLIYLLDYIKEIENKNKRNPYMELISNLIQRYASKDMIDKFKTGIYENGRLNIEKLVQNIKSTFKIYGNSGRIGLDSEAMTQFSLQALADEFNANSSGTMKMTVTHTGGFSARPDIITEVGIEPNNNFKTSINIWFDQNGGKTQDREKLQEFVMDYYNKIKSVNDSFITYTNQKAWNLIGSYFQKGGGFSGGKDMNVFEFERTIANNYSNTQKMIGLLMQIGSGAMWSSEKNKELLRTKIATMVAHFLFDDYVILGREQSKGTQAVHVFNLNGVIVPLSLLLWSLAQAFSSESKDSYREFVRVHLTANKIMFEKGYGNKTGYWPKEAWDAQRDCALYQLLKSAS